MGGLKLTTSDFIERAKKVHDNKYDYSKVDYVNAKEKVCIICKEHGEFWQSPDKHLQGQGCPKCKLSKMVQTNTMTTEQFIEKARQIHGDKYDYSKSEYIKSSIKVCIICKEHGEFWQTPNAHLRGQGCPKCATELTHNAQRKSTDEFISEAKKVHGDKYTYEKTNYISNRVKVTVTCPIHGDFLTSPLKHIRRGDGCPRCRYEKVSLANRMTTEQFIEKARRIHGDRYDYSKTVYKSYDEPLIIICKEHGEFLQTPDSHLQGSGCQRCVHFHSNLEVELCETIKDMVGKDNVVANDRILLKPKELDIVIPSKHIAIEFNGLLWHSEKYGKTSNYHLDKTLKCKEKGYKLFHIFEDEYINNKDIVNHKLKHLLGYNYNLPQIYGRKCGIKEVTMKEGKEFLTKYHIQGYGGCTVNLGAFFNNELVAVMSLKRYGGNKWELVRFATHYGYRVNGACGKLFKHFVKNYDPSEVKSFADRRWTLDESDNMYTKIGFKLDKVIPPSYYYFSNKEGKRVHKFNFRKQILHKKYGLPLELTENEMVEKIGYVKIWDCGLFKYVWKQN